jgi:hypothetical protein
VQCPTCQSIFVAERPAEGPTPVRAEYVAADPRPRRPRDDDEDDDYPERRPRRRWLQPHRGTAVLVLGILSLVMGCFPLGIVSWVMGNSDLSAMRRGEMDPSGEGITQAGRICGMISTILALAGCLLYGLMIVLFALGGAVAHH